MAKCILLAACLLGFAGSAQADLPFADYRYATFDVPGAAATWLYGINSAGDVVGNSSPGTGFVFASGVFIPVQVPTDGYSTIPFGINDHGQVVGVHFGSPFTGFLKDADVYTTLSVPGHNVTQAQGINNVGQVVGITAVSGSHSEGFLWQNGNYSLFSFPGAAFTGFSGINDLGQIVGGANGHGFVFAQGGFTIIDVPGATGNAAWAINNLGQIVGHDATDAFLFNAGEYSKIEVPGSFYTDVYGINDHGVIVGLYGGVDGKTHGFLAEPVPEPATWLMALFAMGAAAAYTCLRSSPSCRSHGSNHSDSRVPRA